MADSAVHLFWDSCCFIAFLNDMQAAYDVGSLQQYIEDAKDGKARIYTSTVALAEVRPSFLVKKGIGSFAEFAEDLAGSVVLLDASPNIMDLAGRLRDLQYNKPDNKPRPLETPDAIMLATCIHLRDVHGVNVQHFHTYDDGKRRGPGGKTVPLLSFEEWCNGFADTDLASRVISLSRKRPIHPEPKLQMNGGDAGRETTSREEA